MKDTRMNTKKTVKVTMGTTHPRGNRPSSETSPNTITGMPNASAEIVLRNSSHILSIPFRACVIRIFRTETPTTNEAEVVTNPMQATMIEPIAA